MYALFNSAERSDRGVVHSRVVREGAEKEEVVVISAQTTRRAERHALETRDECELRIGRSGVVAMPDVVQTFERAWAAWAWGRLMLRHA